MPLRRAGRSRAREAGARDGERRQNPVLRPILIAAAVLVALGILGTFPTFFQAFASDY